jgi:hypothetical protein
MPSELNDTGLMQRVYIHEDRGDIDEDDDEEDEDRDLTVGFTSDLTPGGTGADYISRLAQGPDDDPAMRVGADDEEEGARAEAYLKRIMPV